MKRFTLFSAGLLAMALAMALCAPALAQAAPFAVEDRPTQRLDPAFSVHYNHGEPLTLEAARARAAEGAFEPLPADSATATNFGLTGAEIWLRAELETPAELAPRWLLEVAHASLDRVDVYFAGEDGRFSHQHSGDRIVFSERPLPHRHHVFELPLEPSSQATLYLRVASEGTLTVPVRLWQPDALWHRDQVDYAALSVYYGLLLGLLVYNLFLYLSLRDPLYLIYVAFIGALGVGLGGLSGLVSQFLWPNAPMLAHLSPTAGVSLAGFFGTLFVQRFLGDTPRRLRLGWFMPLMTAGYATTFLVVVLWSYHVAAISVNLLSLIFALGALFLGAVSLYQRQPGARFFVLAWVALLLGVIIIALHNIGVVPSNFATANALLIGSGAEMLLLSLALADRINAIQRAHESSQAEAIEAKHALLEATQENERLLESRVAERTRELEATNARLRESREQLEHQATHDDLTGVVNRKLLADRLEHARAHAARYNEHFALLVVDLDQFKPINDTHGHAAGDALLVAVARRLEAGVRASDTVARTGGDEFVVILDGVAGRAEAMAIADKLAAAIAAPIEHQDAAEPLTIGASIGVSLYPDDGDDTPALLRHADHAMYQRKREHVE
jgi:diguanylate cyclase (GGDEF)-like protein